jgi:hypothetical protein
VASLINPPVTKVMATGPSSRMLPMSSVPGSSGQPGTGGRTGQAGVISCLPGTVGRVVQSGAGQGPGVVMTQVRKFEPGHGGGHGGGSMSRRPEQCGSMSRIPEHQVFVLCEYYFNINSYTSYFYS